MNWCVGGYYGLGNIGDELMCRQVIDWIRQIDPKASVSVLMARNGDPQRLWLPEGIQTLQYPKGKIRAFRRLLKGIDIYVVGGGTCFHRFEVAGLYPNIAARSLGAKVVWLGIGTDTLGSISNHLKGLISIACSHAISVRDTESADQIALLTCGRRPPAYPDIVLASNFSTSGNKMHHAQSANESLVVAWRNLSPYLTETETERAENNASKLIAKLSESLSTKRIVVLNTADSIDESACKRLYRLIERRKPKVSLELYNNVPISEKLIWLQNAGFVLSARLHPLMLSTLGNRPSFGFSYAEKMTRFAGLLEGEHLASVSDLLISPQKVLRKAQEALKHPPVFRQSLKKINKDVQKHQSILKKQFIISSSSGQIIL
jgi:polysaccharide pyruvyl transferase WcaK-like protein